jgi:hypothetical protein
MLSGDKKSKEISENLISLCFDFMQYKEEDHLKGMLRWTQEAWGVCYQDDAARVLISQLLQCLYTGENKYLKECTEALDFLVRTTGTDGTRVQRTDNIKLTPERIRQLAENPANYISTHYNAFYLAALLLCGKLANNRTFIDTGIKGLESIMAAYPHTAREQSETEELCRLIMPLSWLYLTTKEEKHKDWLYMVTDYLQHMKHPSGAYLEWDSDYLAACSRKENSECSLLTKNGDPVVDMLYSINWLPLGFIQAYMVTGDEYFYNLWKDIAGFFIKSQLGSSNPMINGVWTRGFDIDIMEVYGTPNDMGWGPWAVESGWTMGEIIAGLAMGANKKYIFSDNLKEYLG